MSLKLGTQTGSLTNHLYSREPPVKPEIGMGATMLGWSDRHACTITAISPSGKSIEVKQDIATRIDKNGMSELQEYSYEPDPNTKPVTFTLRKNGKWVLKGSSMNAGTHLLVGKRDQYYDYSF